MRYLCALLCLMALPALAQLPAADWKTQLQMSQVHAADRPDSAVIYCNRGMRIAEQQQDKQGQAQLLLQLGKINILHHHTDLARHFTQEAFSIFRRLNDTEGMARSFNELALLEGQQKDMTAATNDLHQAMNYFQHNHDSAGILETYHSMGTIYEEQGDQTNALNYYLRELEQYERSKLKPEAYFTLLKKISDLYLQKGDALSASYYLKGGLKNSPAIVTDAAVELLNDLGSVYEKRGSQLSALNYYKQALEEAKKYHRPQEEIKALVNIASVLQKANISESLKDLKKALQIADSLHQPRLTASIYAAMATVYQQENNYREAMLAMEEQHRLLDSLLESDTMHEMAALDSSYQLESSREQISELQLSNRLDKKELTITWIILAAICIVLLLLWFYFRKVRKLNEDLRVSNRVKDTLFSIIGHDLRGPAGTTVQVFDFMETEQLSETELRTLISHARKQAAASFELLTTLFEWGKAQMQGVQLQQERFDPKHIIVRNINVLSQQAEVKHITIYDNSHTGHTVFADPNQFDFIIRNILSNAIKFTPDHGHVQLHAQVAANGKEIIFSIRDTGIGIDEAQQQAFASAKLQVKFGTKGEKGSGLGLLLTKEFVKANKGRIWLESGAGKGTSFFFSLPVSPKE